MQLNFKGEIKFLNEYYNDMTNFCQTGKKTENIVIEDYPFKRYIGIGFR